MDTSRRKPVVLAVSSLFLIGANEGLARADDPHEPSFVEQMQRCASRIKDLSIPIDAAIPLQNDGVVTMTIPGHPNRDPNDDCNNFSWVSTEPGRYDNVAVAATWAGPKFDKGDEAQNQWDCSHSALIYGVFGPGPNVTGPTGPELKAYGRVFGYWDTASKTCFHDWQHFYEAIKPQGDAAASLNSVNHVVIAVQSWQHNSIPFGHSGTYCADNMDASSACLWDTKLTFVHSGTHFGSGRPQIGVFNGGTWWLDVNNDGYWENASDRKVFNFGQPGDIPVIRNASDGTRSIIGLNNNRTGDWWFDMNQNYAWDGDYIDQHASGFGQPGDLPFAGRFSSEFWSWLYDNIGVYSSGNWWWDSNDNQSWDGTGSGLDGFTNNFGQPGDTPVMGRWSSALNQSGQGVFRDGTWWIDYNGNTQWDASDRVYSFGVAGDQPIVGDWNGNGIDKIGVFRNGRFYLDWNGDGTWDYGDVVYFFGKAGDTAVFGIW